MGEQRDEKKCAFCGMTYADFIRTGLFGCAQCYTVFREELLPTLRLIQGKIRHGGKSPDAEAGEMYDVALEQERLKEGIEEAIRKERYAEAEKLQARLKALNKLHFPGEDRP